MLISPTIYKLTKTLTGSRLRELITVCGNVSVKFINISFLFPGLRTMTEHIKIF